MSEKELREDVASAWASVPNRLGRWRDVRKVAEYLHTGEEVLAMAGGDLEGTRGLLVTTTRRALFVGEGIVSHSFEDFPYDRINTVTTTRGLIWGTITITTAGAARVIEAVRRDACERASQRTRAANRGRRTA